MAIDAAATGQPAARQPILYKRLEPIEPSRHRGLKLDRMGRNYRFVANESVIPLAMSEFVTAGVYYPIVFSDSPEPMPLAVLGYKPGENLFVDAEGRWTAGVYVPWYVRCYPFAMLNGPEDSFVPCVDVEGSGIGPLVGDLLLENDEPTPMLHEIMRFCHGYNRALKETRELGQVLRASGLLAAHEATIGLGGERKPARLTGFHAVDVTKFQELPDKTFLAWRKKGLLTAVYQHLHSLSCWPILSAAAAAKLDKAAAA
jgi:hypothetical protein